MSSISELVKALPECYQPIFGHPDLGVNSSRNCNDRLQKIEGIFISLKEQLGRTLRLLDLGCAQGFFSLSLAKYCEKVTGIDFLDKNVSVCRALAEEQGAKHIEFKEDTIQNVINNLNYDEYDIVLGFSVFHHICDADGYLLTKEKINKLANYAQIVLLELAVKEEGLYWGRHLPDNALDIVEDIGFYDILGEYPTHLSTVSRPLIFSSSKYWYVKGRLEKINHWTKESHEFAQGVHQSSRRYYFSDNFFLKRYSFEGSLAEHNKKDYQSEITSLQQLVKLKLDHLDVPQLVEFDENTQRGIILTSKLSGERLSSVLQNSQIESEIDTVKQVLASLAELETHGLFHNDVRIWNVMHNNGQYKLIDFGAITKKNTDVLWPYNVYLGFIIFINELNARNNYQLVPARTPMFSPYWAKTPKLAQFLSKVWSISHQTWSYQLFQQVLEDIINSAEFEFNVSIPPENLALWMFTTETLFNETRTRDNSLVMHTQAEIVKKLEDLAVMSQHVSKIN